MSGSVVTLFGRRLNAVYVCTRCGHTWKGIAGPTQRDGSPTQCPNVLCQSIHVLWTDAPVSKL